MLLKPVKSHFFVKWLHPRFYSAVSGLECFSCEKFWTAADFRKILAKPRSQGYVVTSLLAPIGFVVFTRRRGVGRILNLVVHPDHRLNTWGSTLLTMAKRRLVEENCKEVVADVRESNLVAHLFLQENEFVATGVSRGFYQDHYEDYIEREDCFHFLWRNHE